MTATLKAMRVPGVLLVAFAAALWGTRWFMLPNPVYGNWDQILPKTVRERMDLLNRASNPAFVEAK